MAHKGGFTATSITQDFLQAGFKQVLTAKRPAAFDLWIFATKDTWADETLKAKAQEFFPV